MMPDRDRVLALVSDEGRTGFEIAQGTDMSVRAVVGWLYSLQSEDLVRQTGSGRWVRTKKEDAGSGRVVLTLDRLRYAALTAEAARRKVPTDFLVSEVMRNVVDDKLYDAVLG